MKYNLPYSLSLALDHLAPVTVTFTIVVMWRQLLTRTTTRHITLRFLALILNYLQTLIAPMPAIHTMGHNLIDRGGDMGELAMELCQLVLWHTNITLHSRSSPEADAVLSIIALHLTIHRHDPNSPSTLTSAGQRGRNESRQPRRPRRPGAPAPTDP